MSEKTKHNIYTILTYVALIVMCCGGYHLVMTGDEPTKLSNVRSPYSSMNYETKGNGQADILVVQETTSKNENNNSSENQVNNETDGNKAEMLGQTESADSNKSDININSQDINADSQKPNTYSSGNSNNGIDQNNNDSPDNTKKIYFSTSIINGETIATFEYYFQINHNYKKLEVEDVQVWVNGTLESHFSGKVILKEGANTVRISVTYRDRNGEEIVAEKSYVVNVNIKDLSITTTLSDCTVDTPYLSFTAFAVMAGHTPNLNVTFNDKDLQPTTNKNEYNVTLKKGKNKIKFVADCNGYELIKEYTITFVAASNVMLYTTLSDRTVADDSIEFSAVIVSGSKKAVITVTNDGKAIDKIRTDASLANYYKVKLNVGTNKILVTAKDTGGVLITKTYTVKYVPKATYETAPQISFINLKDGDVIEGQRYELKIAASDYQGNKIFYDGIEVKLNGKKVQYRWSADYVSYTLSFAEGANTVIVILTDKDGRTRTFTYNVKCTYIDDGSPIGQVTFTMDAKVINIGNLVGPIKVSIYYGDTVADVFERAVKNTGFTYSSSGTTKNGYYLESVARQGMLNGWKIDSVLHNEIEEDGLIFNTIPETGDYVYDMDSLSHLDFCQGSGWAFAVNGEYQKGGMSDIIVRDKDIVEVRYTLAYGKDIGAFDSSSGSMGLKDKYENVY